MWKNINLILALPVILTGGFVLAQSDESQPPPPNGIFLAIADINARTGENFELICEEDEDGEIVDGSTCAMNDFSLNWKWEFVTYEDTRMGCETRADDGPEKSGYHYTLTYGEVPYEYYQYFTTGILFLCTPTGAEVVLPDYPPLAAECPLPTRLSIGMRARVTPGLPNNLRSGPGTSAAKVGPGEIPGSGEFTVVGGPTCASGMNYWQVNYQGTIGWTAEGKNGDYWLEPIMTMTLPTVRAPINAQNVSRLLASITLSNSSIMAISSTNLLAVGLAESNGVEVYNLSSPQPVPLIIDSPHRVSYVAFNPVRNALGQTILALLEYDETNARPQIRLVEAAGGTDIQTIFLEPGQGDTLNTVNALAFSPDGQLLSVASGDQFVVSLFSGFSLYDVNTGQLFARVPAQAITDTLFSPDGTLLVVRAGTETLIYDVTVPAAPTLQRTIPDTFNLAIGNTMAFSPDGTWLAIAMFDRTSTGFNSCQEGYVRVWNVATGEEYPLMFCTGEETPAVTFSPDGTLLAAGGSISSVRPTGSIKIWDFATGNLLVHRIQNDAAYSNVQFSSDGTLFISASFGQVGVQLWTVAQ